MPAFMLKKIVLGNFAKGPVDSKMADAIDFMVDRVSAALTNRVSTGCRCPRLKRLCLTAAGESEPK